MAEYSYEGVDKAGKKVSGKLDAADEGQLRMSLRGNGIRPTKITGVSAMNRDMGSFLKGGTLRVTTDQMVGFTRQLHALISAGIPLVQALDVLGDQAEGGLRTILPAVKENVSAGKFFWESIAAYPKAFPKIYVALIRAGEASGAMDGMLKRLSRYLEDANRLKKLLQSAMIYPAGVVTVGIGVIALMLIFVIPKFEELLKGSGQELPAPTAFVINLSHFMVNNILFIVPGTAIVCYLAFQYLSSEEGRTFRDRALFKAPLFGAILQKGGTARFARTLQTLLASGVNLIDAIDICKMTIDNAVIEQAVGTIRAEVEAGKPLALVVERTGVFPRMAVQMIAVGENTGALDKMLEKVADFYEEEVEVLVGGLTKLIEPFILVFLGGAVGGLMIAMYLPIFKMAGGGE